MTHAAARGATPPGGRHEGRLRRQRAEGGFAIVEILAATTILVIVLASFSTLLVDSLRAALVSNRTQIAAGVASDMVENAKALGQSSLGTDLGLTVACTSLGTQAVPVPVRTAAATGATATVALTDIRQCFTISLDRYTYTVTPTVTIGTPDIVRVVVTWSPSGTYTTFAQIGS